MAIRTSVPFNGSADQMFALMTARLSDVGLKEFLDDMIDPFIRERITLRFHGEGDDLTGGAWAPLGPGTQARRQSAGFPPDHPINVRTAMMMDFLTQTPGESGVGGGGAWIMWPRAYPTQEMEDKVRTAQAGSSKPHTVPRPVIGLNGTDNEFLQNELVRYIMGI